MDIVDKVLESVATTGGASINLASGSTPDAGYMVSRAGSEIVISDAITSNSSPRRTTRNWTVQTHTLVSGRTMRLVWSTWTLATIWTIWIWPLRWAPSVSNWPSTRSSKGRRLGYEVLGSKRDWIRSRRYATRRDRRIPRSRSSRSAGRALDCWNCA